MARFENPFPLGRDEGRPQAEILNIGTELLTGSVLNTNASFLARELTQMGFQVSHQTSCLDEPHSIREALRLALERSRVIFVSGGLGPTPDDITRECLADFFQVPLLLSQTQYQRIRNYYREKGQRVPPLVRREACFPANARPVVNHFGIALGFIIEEKGETVIALPGVPGELTRLFGAQLKPFLKRKFPWLCPQASLIVKLLGLSEPTVMRRLGQDFFKIGDFQFGIYPEVGEVTLRIYADSPRLIKRLKGRIVRTLGKDVYGFSEISLEAVLGQKLKARKWSVAIAESCTGGQISERITRVPGASHYFRGGVVAYQDQVKLKTLGIPSLVIKKRGAVSNETAVAMAREVRLRLGSTLGIGVTGIAGPSGGTVKKPVGLIYVAIASSQRHRSWELQLQGDREQIQRRATQKTLEHLWRWLQK